jgi:hypothetical protein
LKINYAYAGVAEWVDAQDLKTATRGFSQGLIEAESPFFLTACYTSTSYTE